MKKQSDFEFLEEKLEQLEGLRKTTLAGIRVLEGSTDPKGLATLEDMKKTLGEMNDLIPIICRMLGRDAKNGKGKSALLN